MTSEAARKEKTESTPAVEVNLAVAIIVSFVAGFVCGISAARVVWYSPTMRLEALERRVDELLRRRDGSG